MKRILLVIVIFSFYQLNAQQTTALIKLAPAKPTESKYIEPDMKTFNLYNPYENVDSALALVFQMIRDAFRGQR